MIVREDSSKQANIVDARKSWPRTSEVSSPDLAPYRIRRNFPLVQLHQPMAPFTKEYDDCACYPWTEEKNPYKVAQRMCAMQASASKGTASSLSYVRAPKQTRYLFITQSLSARYLFGIHSFLVQILFSACSVPVHCHLNSLSPAADCRFKSCLLPDHCVLRCLLLPAH